MPKTLCLNTKNGHPVPKRWNLKSLKNVRLANVRGIFLHTKTASNKRRLVNSTAFAAWTTTTFIWADLHMLSTREWRTLIIVKRPKSAPIDSIILWKFSKRRASCKTGCIYRITALFGERWAKSACVICEACRAKVHTKGSWGDKLTVGR